MTIKAVTYTPRCPCPVSVSPLSQWAVMSFNW